MHPLVARIHPAFRTAFTAWLLARGALIFALSLSGYDFFDITRSELGLMSWVWSAVDVLDANVTSIDDVGTWTLLLVGEFAILAAGMAVFYVTRRDAIPAAAERATWFWFCSPLMFIVPPGSPWTLTLGLGLGALHFAMTQRGRWAAVLVGLAILIRPEAILIVPAAVALSARNKANDDEPFAIAGAATLAFSGLVFGTMFFSDSPRMLYESGTWRQNWNPVELVASPADLGVISVCLVVLVLVLSQAKRTGSLLILSVPILLWPVLQEPSIASATPLLLGASVFGAIAQSTQNPTFERPLLLISFASLVFLPFV